MTQPSYDLHRQHRLQPREYSNYHINININDHANPTCIHNEPIPILTSHTTKEQRHINTLFVSGLPDDVIPREIHNLFRRRPGFDSCQLEFTGRRNQVVAFVTFLNHQSAVMALQALDGVKFDPQAGSVLHIELARSNSRRKRKSGSGPYVVIDKRRKAADDSEEASSNNAFIPLAGNSDSESPSQSGDPDSTDHDGHSTLKVDEREADTNDNEAAVKKQTDRSFDRFFDGDSRPCSTLFIANLGPDCSEEELREALSQYPGLNGLKLRARGGMPVAFADYEEVEQATSAMQALQGSMLPSSDRGGTHIEYARSKMRKP